MSYLAFARKYRPQRFSEVIGQKAVVQTLQNALKSGRLHHAYLFTGVRGIGKTTVARILAKAMNCEKGPAAEPCCECESCTNIAQGSSLAVQEIDGASNTGVDDVRQIREQVRYLSPGGRYKVYIIDEVHMLSTPAFNALLKTLEEPPEHVIFMFATTESHKIPATILSRCQRYDLRRIPTAHIANSIADIASKEGIKINGDASALIAHEAGGSLRDAQSLFDQAVAYCGDEVEFDKIEEMLGATDRTVVVEIAELAAGGDVATALKRCESIYERGVDLARLSSDLLTIYRHLLVISSGADAKALVDLPASDRERLESLAKKRNLSAWQQGFNIAYGLCSEVARSPLPRASLEAAVIRLSQIEDVTPIGEILEELSKAEGSNAGMKSAESQVANSTPPTARSSAGRLASSKSQKENKKDEGDPSISKDRWDEFCRFVGQKEPSMAAIIADCGLCSQENEIQLTLDSPFHAEMLEEPDRKKRLSKLICDFFGTPFSFSAACASDDRKKKAASGNDPRYTEAVNHAKDILGAAVQNTRTK